MRLAPDVAANGKQRCSTSSIAQARQAWSNHGLRSRSSMCRCGQAKRASPSCGGCASRRNLSSRRLGRKAARSIRASGKHYREECVCTIGPWPIGRWSNRRACVRLVRTCRLKESQQTPARERRYCRETRARAILASVIILALPAIPPGRAWKISRKCRLIRSMAIMRREICPDSAS